MPCAYTNQYPFRWIKLAKYKRVSISHEKFTRSWAEEILRVIKSKSYFERKGYDVER